MGWGSFWEKGGASKKDSEVIKSLEDCIMRKIRIAENRIDNDKEEEAKENLEYANNMMGIRGYKSKINQEFHEISEKYFDKFK